MDEARKIVSAINQISVPLVADMNGFLRVQDAKMGANDKILVLLHHKDPERVKDIELAKWTKYRNLSRFRNEILPSLDHACLIHYEGGECSLLPNGKIYVQKNIPLELLS